MIEAKALTKKYGNFTAVRQANFTAKQGEIVGLLGPNGAGKTTIMRMLTGYTPPTSGTAIIAGFDVQIDSLDAREHVGYLPERIPIYPDMTVREYVSYWAELRGLRDRRRRMEQVDLVIERVQLTFKRNKLVRSLSKGMRQRLGLAQALVHNPDIVILDEPTIGIDPQQVIEVRELVRSLGQEHCVLFSTHILTEAEQVCDRLLIINQGRIVAEGTPEKLRRQLQDVAELYVEISGGTSQEISGLLVTIPGVFNLTPDGDGYRLSASDEGVRERIFDTIATSSALKLVELRAVSMTLEDIFLKLIGGDV